MVKPGAQAALAPDIDSKNRLRLWIRLLHATRALESEVRSRLKSEFDSTLPRFDVLSALDRRGEGMLMSELSQYLMVSNGNVTVVVDRLVEDELVVRTARAGDRRAWVVTLTPAGRQAFARMAAAHERWIDELMADVSREQADAIMRALGPLTRRKEDEAK